MREINLIRLNKTLVVVSPHVMEFKTLLDSGFDVVDSGFWVLDSVLFVPGTYVHSSLEEHFSDEVTP